MPSFLVGNFDMLTDDEAARLEYIEAVQDESGRQHRIRINFTNKQPPMDLWFSDGPRPLLTKMRVDPWEPF